MVEDARIRLALVRLYLDQGRALDAEVQLEAADELLQSHPHLFRMERDALWARLDIQRGAYETAFKRLRKTLRRAAPQGEPRTWRALLWQLQLNSEREAMTEAYALLAIAALETGRRGECDWAFDEARNRGVDLSLLQRSWRRDRLFDPATTPR